MRRRRSPSGHSLLEAMLAGVILVVGLFGVVSALGSGMSVQAHNHHLTAALHVGEKTMERLLWLPLSHPSLGADVVHDGPRYDIDATETTTGSFSTQWQVSAGPLDGSVLIAVKVTWPERFQSRSLTLRTYR